eukprot:tig00000471_g1189.t1
MRAPFAAARLPHGLGALELLSVELPKGPPRLSELRALETHTPSFETARLQVLASTRLGRVPCTVKISAISGTARLRVGFQDGLEAPEAGAPGAGPLAPLALPGASLSFVGDPSFDLRLPAPAPLSLESAPALPPAPSRPAPDDGRARRLTDLPLLARAVKGAAAAALRETAVWPRRLPLLPQRLSPRPPAGAGGDGAGDAYCELRLLAAGAAPRDAHVLASRPLPEGGAAWDARFALPVAAGDWPARLELRLRKWGRLGPHRPLGHASVDLTTALLAEPGAWLAEAGPGPGRRGGAGAVVSEGPPAAEALSEEEREAPSDSSTSSGAPAAPSTPPAAKKLKPSLASALAAAARRLRSPRSKSAAWAT